MPPAMSSPMREVKLPMNASDDVGVQTHRYFDDVQEAPSVKRQPLKPRTLALLFSVFAAIAAVLAIWLVTYETVGAYLGLGLVLLGFVASAIARRADNSVRLLPAIAVSLLLVAGSTLSSSLILIRLLAQI